MIHFILPGLTVIMFMLMGCQTTGEVVTATNSTDAAGTRNHQ